MKTQNIFLIIILLLQLHASAQSEWVHVYHDDMDAPKLFFIESYDHGYLLMGRNKWSYPKYNWLIKTDINGNVLWEKTFGNGNDGINIYGLALNIENDLFFVGRNSLVGDYPDPMIMKLNVCGEKEWCKIFSSPGYTDYYRGLCTTSDGGCATIMLGESLGDKDYLCRFSKEGELLWQYYYPPTTGQTGLERTKHLILTPDQGFLMSGSCYYSNPWDTLSYLSPYYIKADSLGNFEWELVAGLHPNNIGGKAHTTVIGPDSNFFYSSISHYYRNGIGDAPGLLVMDMNGQMDTVYDLSLPGYYGILDDARFITDTTLAASADWDNHPYPKAVIIDTVGHILYEQDLVDEIYMASVQTSFDNKALFYTMEYIEQDEQWDTYLFKLNQQLVSDTIYIYPYQYDTLCPYPIESDTITQEGCDIIVGIEENPITQTEEPAEILVIYPNPAESVIQINIQDLETSSIFVIAIYDLYGRKQDEIIMPAGQDKVYINVSSFHAGIYIAILRDENRVVGREKFVVR
ncbi:MAG: T9SS type A sorting domain-containing protein [Bacteroidales bacterium]|nr:T9SS type A sorting domain-containing protein [Bacteroidales bacterium]